MRLSRLEVLMLVAGLGGMGACRRGPPPEPAAVPTTPADSTMTQAAAPTAAVPGPATEPEAGTGGPGARP
jgi:hypothetical protein